MNYRLYGLVLFAEKIEGYRKGSHGDHAAVRMLYSV
jgi:hypothetical protein